jgi:hypothetical protein
MRWPILLLLSLATPARAEDPLDPLRRRVAADLKEGKPLVATVHVALCDNRVIWCGRLGNGDAAGRNLYWGAAAGLRAYFDHRRPVWRRIHLDKGDGEQVLERVVYRMHVRRPSGVWRRLGVNRPFEVLLVGLAHRGTRIGVANDTFVKQVATEQGETLKLSDGRTVAFGGKGHLVGYAGHDHLMDLEYSGGYKWPRRTRAQPLGFFILACRTALYFKNHLCDAGKGIRGLLLTRTLMYPGAFTIDGLLRGIAAGEGQHAVYMRGVRRYARFQKRPVRLIRGAFTHDGEKRFARRYGTCEGSGKN